VLLRLRHDDRRGGRRWRLRPLHVDIGVVRWSVLGNNIACMAASRDPSQNRQPTVDKAVTATAPLEANGEGRAKKRQNMETHLESSLDFLTKRSLKENLLRHTFSL